MKQKDAAGTVTSILVPVAGTHEVEVKIDSGAVLGSYMLHVVPSTVYAPSTKLGDDVVIPRTIETGGLLSFTFAAQDRFTNAVGVGGAPFKADIVTTTTDAGSAKGWATVTDHENGTYSLDTQFVGKGTQVSGCEVEIEARRACVCRREHKSGFISKCDEVLDVYGMCTLDVSWHWHACAAECQFAMA